MKATRIGGAVLSVLIIAGLVAVRAQRVREKEQAATVAPAPVVVAVARVRTGQVHIIPFCHQRPHLQLVYRPVLSLRYLRLGFPRSRRLLPG